MFNRKLESPLDIAQNLAMDNASYVAKKKQAYILEELERSCRSDEFRYMAIDCSKISLKLYIFFILFLYVTVLFAPFLRVYNRKSSFYLPPTPLEAYLFQPRLQLRRGLI